MSRRDFIKLALSEALIGMSVSLLPSCKTAKPSREPDAPAADTTRAVQSTFKASANGFDPQDILTSFDQGEIQVLPHGQLLHEYKIHVISKEIEIMPGIRSLPGRIMGVCQAQPYACARAIAFVLNW
jgi:hypothetical protein